MHNTTSCHMFWAGYRGRCHVWLRLTRNVLAQSTEYRAEMQGTCIDVRGDIKIVAVAKGRKCIAHF